VEVTGGCLSGELVRVVCTLEGASGTVTAARLGFSVVHRVGVVGPDGSVRDVVEVEPSVGGALQVVLVVPEGFASSVVSAPGAVEVSPRRVVWRTAAAPGAVQRFEVVRSGAAQGVSEAGEVSVELVRDAAPVVVSAFGPVDAPSGVATSRLRVVADRDVDGVAPRFTDPEPELLDVVQGRLAVSRLEVRAESNGAYSGPVSGHVENVYSDSLEKLDRLAGFGVNGGLSSIAWTDFGRVESRSERFRRLWGTSSNVPFAAHEVISQASMEVGVQRGPDQISPSGGPQSVDGGGGVVALSRASVPAWATGLTSQSLVGPVHVPAEAPSRSGDAVALLGLVLDVQASGGDVDNRDGTDGAPGVPFVVDAPPGWGIGSLVFSTTSRIDIDVEFVTDASGSRVVLTPVLAAGAVFPTTFEGAPYRNSIPLVVLLEPAGVLSAVPPVPTPVPVVVSSGLDGDPVVTVHSP
jgi:hypothetical protein